MLVTNSSFDNCGTAMMVRGDGWDITSIGNVATNTPTFFDVQGASRVRSQGDFHDPGEG
jgi:hypothetical protein